MEDDLELSLGLSLGGFSGKFKARDDPLEPKAEPQVEERSSKVFSQAPGPPFVHYYKTNAENQEQISKQRNSPVSPSFGNLWGHHGGSSAPMADGSNEPINHQSQLPRYQDEWISNNNGNNSEENKSVLSKRKFLSEETSFPTKLQTAADHPDAFSKCSDGGVKNALISISTDDGSTGENEDVAESEAEGSNSWLVAQREDSGKCSVVNRGSDIKRSIDGVAGASQGKRQPSFSGSESSSGKLPHRNPLPVQESNVVSVLYQNQTQVSAPPSITSTSKFPSVCTVQLRPPISNGLAVHTMGGVSQVTFGYPTGQLPMLETSSSWAFGAPPQAISSFTGKDRFERAGAKQTDDGKKPREAGASSSVHVEDDKADRESPLMGSAIRPGIAPNVKFAGSGSYPDLPWVSTTGTGPNGRTISGVTYNFGRNEVKIVCACHGAHMTPEEFMQHASADTTGQEINTTLPAFPTGNQAASAQN